MASISKVGAYVALAAFAIVLFGTRADALSSTCPAAAQSCLVSQKSLLLIKNNIDAAKDKLTWKWIKGAGTDLSDLGDPTSTANYALCIYAGTTDTLVAQMYVPRSNKWSTHGTKGYKFFDSTLADDGAQKILLKSGTAGKSKALVKGRGVNLPDPLDAGPMLPLPVTVQLFNYQTGVCFDSTFTTALKNSTSLFKAKSP